jgi:hypothetical protein
MGEGHDHTHEECNGNHWSIENNKLLLTTDTEEKRELLKTVVKAVEAEVRLTIYNEICDWKPLENRTAIIKMAGSLDNALLGVQAICADIALGKSNERATSE